MRSGERSGAQLDDESARTREPAWLEQWLVPLGILFGIGVLGLTFLWLVTDPETALERLFPDGLGAGLIAIIGIMIAIFTLASQQRLAREQTKAATEVAQRSDWWNHYQWIVGRIWPDRSTPTLPTDVSLASLNELIRSAPDGFDSILR